MIVDVDCFEWMGTVMMAERVMCEGAEAERVMCEEVEAESVMCEGVGDVMTDERRLLLAGGDHCYQDLSDHLSKAKNSTSSERLIAYRCEKILSEAVFAECDIGHLV